MKQIWQQKTLTEQISATLTAIQFNSEDVVVKKALYRKLPHTKDKEADTVLRWFLVTMPMMQKSFVTPSHPYNFHVHCGTYYII